jgi:hypothetical protein
MDPIDHTICYTFEELKQMVKASSYEYVNYVNGYPVHKILDPEALDGEVFRKHPEKDIEVSNLGRVRGHKGIIEQNDNDIHGKGWLYVKFDDLLKRRQYVYRLVAETWLVRPKNMQDLQVHHISNNYYDNRPDNLIWLKKTTHYEIPSKTKYKKPAPNNVSRETLL